MKYLNIVDGVVNAAMASPQDPEVWPNVTEVEDDDPRYLAYITPLTPSPAAVAAVRRDELLTYAMLRIAPLQYAVDVDEATAEETALLKKWKKHSITLNRLDLTADPVAWPEQPA